MISWLKALCKPRQRRWPLVAGLALGLLFLTRQLSAVAMALPAFLLLMARGARMVARRLDGPLVVARTPDTRSLQALTTHFPQRHVYRLVEDRLLPLDGSP
jgi:hypothetical protein